jgi:ADP-ribose pyrophosphatase YjhB (NUDIX family)
MPAPPTDSRTREGPTREWLVAGGLIESARGVLLVRNLRRGGFEDWSTPGGVIDAQDETLIAGLTREVEEETGLHVDTWSGPLYEVHAVAADMGWTMRCEVHLAVDFAGDVRVDDPDGIVVEAAFVPTGECMALLASCPPWVREPLCEWLGERWGPEGRRAYAYEVHGTARENLHVVRCA